MLIDSGVEENRMKKLWVVVACLALGTEALAAEPASRGTELQMGPGVGITIYNANFGVVKERRLLDLKKGVDTLKFTGVASAIDATSVHFTSLTDPKGVQILEQNYEFDLVSADKILKKYLDKKIRLTLKAAGSEKSQVATGYLKSHGGAAAQPTPVGHYDRWGRYVQTYPRPADGKLILASKADGGEIQIIDRSAVRDITCAELPEGLITKPTLVWRVASEKAGKHLCKIAYMTSSISWKCDYTAVLKKGDKEIDLAGWVTINNNSGARYRDARIKLIAGDVHRVTTPTYGRAKRPSSAAESDRAAGFQEKSFAEYHMYTLGRPSTINEKQVKQIELIEPALGVPVTKFYLYHVGAKRPRVMVEFENSKKNKLGIALPRGKVRVYQRDEADGSLEFIGEDQIDHTPRDEKVKLYIGDAFDIIGESKQTAYQSGKRWSRYTQSVELRNHKDDAVEIRVQANVSRASRFEKQTVDGKPVEGKRLDAARMEWRVNVPAKGKAVLVYTVFRSW